MHKLALGLVAAGVLAGCASENAGGSAHKTDFGLLRAAMAERKSPPAPVKLTAAAVAQSPLPLIAVTVEEDGRSTLLARIATNAGVETYSTADKMTVSMRDGIVVATRGFGTDLMSSQPPSASQIARGAGTYRRSYQILDGADRTRNLVLSCSLSATGLEQVVVASKEVSAQHVKENCASGNHLISNDYWVNSSGRIVQSRQWISDESGFLRVERP